VEVAVKWNNKTMIVSIVVLSLIAFVTLFGGYLMSNVEQAKYTVLEKHGNIEIRQYPSIIVAETEVAGDRSVAISEGFKLIADYIFGNNTASTKVAMTAPVTQQTSHKISMTAPVIQQAAGEKWTVRFVMPAEYSMATLPKPNNPRVQLKTVPSKKYAVIEFSGFARQDNLDKNSLDLTAFLTEKKIKALSERTYAFYNPPWTMPFLRRNEVMIEIE
jgi:effector-binding domain-containing protein